MARLYALKAKGQCGVISRVVPRLQRHRRDLTAPGVFVVLVWLRRRGGGSSNKLTPLMVNVFHSGVARRTEHFTLGQIVWIQSYAKREFLVTMENKQHLEMTVHLWDVCNYNNFLGDSLRNVQNYWYWCHFRLFMTAQSCRYGVWKNNGPFFFNYLSLCGC